MKYRTRCTIRLVFQSNAASESAAIRAARALCDQIVELRREQAGVLSVDYDIEDVEEVQARPPVGRTNE